MRAQVVVGAVGDADDLHPPEAAGVDLGVPAVGRIVCPLVGEMLAEPESCRVHADGGQDLVRERDVVGDVLVYDHSLVHRSAHRKPGWLLILKLPLDGEEGHGVVSVAVEGRVVFLVRVDEDLGLCLGELTQPDHALAGGDLVPVGFPDLDRTEGEFVPVEAQEPGEIGEDTLGSLGAQVSLPLRSRPDGGLEHQVERKDARFTQGFLADGAGQFMERCLERFCRERAGIRDAVIVRDVIGAQVFAAVRALHHLVSELFHVTGCDEDCFDSNGGAFDLIVAFLKDVERPPEVFDVPLHHRSERAVIDKTGDRPVYLG